MISQPENREFTCSVIQSDSDEPERQSARQLAEMLGKCTQVVTPLPNAKDINERAMRPHAEAIFAELVQRCGDRATAGG